MADPYDVLAREAAADRRRLRVAAVAALACHLLLLVVPLPSPGDGLEVHQAPAVAPFRLQEVRFAPPPLEPVAPEPPEPAVMAVPPMPLEVLPEPERAAEPRAVPPVASAEILLPQGTAGNLVPPQPLVTPPPPYPESVWSRGIHGDVVLTLVVDGEGRVVDVTVEEGPEPLGGLAAATARRWLFLPASLGGNAITTAIRVHVHFPRPAALRAVEPPLDAAPAAGESPAVDLPPAAYFGGSPATGPFSPAVSSPAAGASSWSTP